MNKLGCSFLEYGINFDYNMVNDCCISHHDNRGLPVLLKDYHGEQIDWEYLFSIKEKRIKNQQQKTIFECEGCYHLSEYSFQNEHKISEFHFSHCRLCNAKCIYCSKEYSEGSINYDTYPIVKDLIEKGYYKSGGEATFQGGEPTIMKHFDELIDLFIQNGTKVRVHSSGIRFSKTIYNALKQDKGNIVVSLDSATSSTYTKIKQINAFECVICNIQKYSEANINNIILKYIIIPGINDNIKEMDKFFELLKQNGIQNTALDIELQYARKYEYKNVSPHIYLLVDYFQHKAQKLGLNVLIYSFLTYVLKNRKIKENIYTNVPAINHIIVNVLKKRSQNIDYQR